MGWANELDFLKVPMVTPKYAAKAENHRCTQEFIWTKEAEEIEEHYKKFGDKLPKELKDQLENLKANLAKM